MCTRTWLSSLQRFSEEDTPRFWKILPRDSKWSERYDERHGRRNKVKRLVKIRDLSLSSRRMRRPRLVSTSIWDRWIYLKFRWKVLGVPNQRSRIIIKRSGGFRDCIIQQPRSSTSQNMKWQTCWMVLKFSPFRLPSLWSRRTILVSKDLEWSTRRKMASFPAVTVSFEESIRDRLFEPPSCSKLSKWSQAYKYVYGYFCSAGEERLKSAPRTVYYATFLTFLMCMCTTMPTIRPRWDRQMKLLNERKEISVFLVLQVDRDDFQLNLNKLFLHSTMRQEPFKTQPSIHFLKTHNFTHD